MTNPNPLDQLPPSDHGTPHLAGLARAKESQALAWATALRRLLHTMDAHLAELPPAVREDAEATR